MTFIFLFCTLWLSWKIFKFGIKAAWGISKLIVSVVLLPILLCWLLFKGLVFFAFTGLIILGVVTLIKEL